MLRKLGLSAFFVGAACLGGVALPVAAQESMQAGMFDRLRSEGRVFWRLNTVYTNTKTTSGDAYDVTGDAVNINELKNMAAAMKVTPSAPTCVGAANRPLCAHYNQAVDALASAVLLDQPGRAGLGTPSGIKARAGNGGTLAISAGLFLDETKTWAAEALLLGLPLKVSVYGDGVNPTGQPNGINGQRIITTKLLPPTALLGRYFGEPNSIIRPYVGLGAMYAVFFDTKATDALNTYEGGQSSGDTKVSIKNVFGVGPFLGLQAQLPNGWHASLNIGQVRLKTTATLTTQNTVITSQSAVTRDYGPNINNAILASGSTYDGAGSGGVPLYPNGFNTRLLSDYANYKANGTIPGTGGAGSATLGTYVRKQDTVLDNTIMMLSIGRSF